MKFVRILRYWKKLATTYMVDCVLLFKMMALGNQNLHMICFQLKHITLSIVILDMHFSFVHVVK